MTLRLHWQRLRLLSGWMVQRLAGALGWRRLTPQERAFVRQHFGDDHARWLVAHCHLGVRRIGDTRRALSLNGGWLSMPRNCFDSGDGRYSLQLGHPMVAGVWAHELLHVLQRHYGMPVTRQAAGLQCRWVLTGKNPYSYRCCHSALQQLRIFWDGHVEQQGQIWQDYVQAVTAGHAQDEDVKRFWLVAAAVRAGRLRRRYQPGVKTTVVG